MISLPDKLIEFDAYPPQLYDIAQDPGEHNDLAKQRPGDVEQLQTQLPPPMPMASGAPDPSPSSQTLEQLRALGYLPEERPQD